MHGLDTLQIINIWTTNTGKLTVCVFLNSLIYKVVSEVVMFFRASRLTYVDDEIRLLTGVMSGTTRKLIVKHIQHNIPSDSLVECFVMSVVVCGLNVLFLSCKCSGWSCRRC